MKLLIRTRDAVLLERLKDLLTHSEVPFVLKDGSGAESVDAAGGVPELWVEDDADEPYATELLSEARADDQGEYWVCAKCGEENEPQFSDCFHCGSHRRARPRV
jgi:hypothetical protein